MSSPETFPFQDLPGEIRDKIYKILLCEFDSGPRSSTASHEDSEVDAHERRLLDYSQGGPLGGYEITEIMNHIQPQILRTCRAVHDEAKYVMLKTNCFIKIIIRMEWETLGWVLNYRQVPFIRGNAKTAMIFRSCVMSHEIVGNRPGKGAGAFFILRRDLDLFCEALRDYRHILDEPYAISHTVTLLNPYRTRDSAQLPKFYNRKFRQNLIAPYRNLIRTPRFVIKGVISRDDIDQAVQEITSEEEIDLDPVPILSNLDNLKAEGKVLFGLGNLRMAYQIWYSILHSIHRFTTGSEGQVLLQTGGTEFLDHLASMQFDIHSNKVQFMLQAIRADNMDGHHSAHELVSTFTRLVEETIHSTIPGCTWTPSPQQLAKIFYREAVGYRLCGWLQQAVQSIDIALRQDPGNRDIMREKREILDAMGILQLIEIDRMH